MTVEAPMLLDTCATIWISNDEPLAPQFLDELQSMRDAGQAIYVSPITAWEMGLLVSRGRVNLQMSPERWFSRLMDAPGLQLSEMPPSVLLASSFLPGTLPADPADRILAATAREFGYRLVTRDRPLLDYGRQGHINTLAC
jgi:PIN domain nuclease of toxin-antitoxin system